LAPQFFKINEAGLTVDLLAIFEQDDGRGGKHQHPAADLGLKISPQGETRYRREVYQKSFDFGGDGGTNRTGMGFKQKQAKGVIGSGLEFFKSLDGFHFESSFG